VPSKLETGLAGVLILFPETPKLGVLIVNGFTFIGSYNIPLPPALAPFPDDDPTSSRFGC
jgi:hypothetical protein